MTVGLQLVAIYTPVLEDFFQVNPLSPGEIAVCVASGIVVFAAIELRKRISR
ncbi:MAG: cation transporting ATPase C-terminal domain-containing protein [Anaerolineae bacterium]|nr:cation transporting ATPase C-terminal domain-containing protein [Anaerolineae bacterium]